MSGGDARRSDPSPRATPPPFPCGHRGPGQRAGYRQRCTECGSFLDLDTFDRTFVYDDAYPQLRHHDDALVGALKVETLRRWLERVNVDAHGLSVCEVGFGGGACLRFLQGLAAWGGGIEVVDVNLRSASASGIPLDRLFDGRSLPATLPRSIDLWIFQDSFEHLPDPAGFVSWMVRSSSDASRILLVAPEAGSPSERLLGRLWPHRLPDHPFHWSRAGLEEFFAMRGFTVETRFRPAKLVSLKTLLAHVSHKFARGSPPRTGASRVPSLSFSFNVGEMGLLFRRRHHA